MSIPSYPTLAHLLVEGLNQRDYGWQRVVGSLLDVRVETKKKEKKKEEIVAEKFCVHWELSYWMWGGGRVKKDKTMKVTTI